MTGRGADRIIDLVDWLGAQVLPVGLGQVATSLALPKSSTLGLLLILVRKGIAERLPDGTYVLARLPGEAPARVPAMAGLMRVAQPFIAQAAERAGETAFLAVMTRTAHIRYIVKVLPSRQEIIYDRDISFDRPAMRTASGIIMLAGMDAAALDAFRAELDPVARKTLASLAGVVAEAGRAGFAKVARGSVEGASGVAAAVEGPGRMPIAAINIAGPSERVLPRLDELGAIASEAARAISAELIRTRVRLSGDLTRQDGGAGEARPNV